RGSRRRGAGQAAGRGGRGAHAPSPRGPGAPGPDRHRDRRPGAPPRELGRGCAGSVPALRPCHRRGVRGHGRAARQGGRVRHPGAGRGARGPDRGRLLRRHGTPRLTHDLAAPGARLAIQLPRPRAARTVSHPEAVRWSADTRAVDLLDQTRLPEAEVRLRLTSAEQVAEAIRVLRVRGAPAIGVAAALGVAVEMERWTDRPAPEFRARLDETLRLLRATRPTAVNLPWALDRLAARAAALAGASNAAVALALRAEATAILEEDRAMCRRIGEYG